MNNSTPIEHKDLKAAITALGGQKAVADRFGIPYRTVQNWYRGERTPPEYVTRMIVLYNEDELSHLVGEWYSGDVITELRKINEDLMQQNRELKEKNKANSENQEALAWYESELTKARATIDRLELNITQMLHTQEAIEEEAKAYRELWEEAEEKYKKEKKAREIWVRQAGMLTK